MSGRFENFGDSLKDILNRRGLSVKEFSKRAGVSQSTVYSWMRNVSQPCLSGLIFAADYLRCSIEFLIGRSDDESPAVGGGYLPFATRVREVMRESKVSTYKLRKISQYDGAYFRNWDNGSEPLLSTLIELSSIFDCSIDYLTGRVLFFDK